METLADSSRPASLEQHPPAPPPEPEPRVAFAEGGPPPSSPAAKKPPFQWLPCASPGNPVFSCMLDPKALTTRNFLTKPQALLYKTTSSDYGSIPPTSPMVPCHFYPRDNAYTNYLFACGLSGFNCINTGVDKSKVCDHLDIMNVL